MEKGFKVTQPRCFGCANGVAQVMLGTCAEPGGIKSGSRVDQVQAGSNYLVERAEARNKFDEEREKRRAAAAKHFQQVLQATAATPARPAFCLWRRFSENAKSSKRSHRAE